MSDSDEILDPETAYLLAEDSATDPALPYQSRFAQARVRLPRGGPPLAGSVGGVGSDITSTPELPGAPTIEHTQVHLPEAGIADIMRGIAQIRNLGDWQLASDIEDALIRLGATAFATPTSQDTNGHGHHHDHDPLRPWTTTPDSDAALAQLPDPHSFTRWGGFGDRVRTIPNWSDEDGTKVAEAPPPETFEPKNANNQYHADLYDFIKEDLARQLGPQPVDPKARSSPDRRGFVPVQGEKQDNQLKPDKPQKPAYVSGDPDGGIEDAMAQAILAMLPAYLATEERQREQLHFSGETGPDYGPEQQRSTPAPVLSIAGLLDQPTSLPPEVILREVLRSSQRLRRGVGPGSDPHGLRSVLGMAALHLAPLK